MIIRVRYQVRGGHVHCRVFTTAHDSPTYGTFAKVGELVFAIDEWEAVRARLPQVEFMEEEDRRDHHR